MIENVDYRYISCDEIDTPQYKDFVEKYHGKGSYESWKQRLLWYWQRGNANFKVFTASIDGHFAGQSCAYRVYISINNRIEELWWGVDTFVLPEYRGKGIGKRLQKELHQALPNFSSAWYSPTNGVIKRKCGGHSLFSFPFAFYPVSSFISILLELGVKKMFNYKGTMPRVRLPWLYATLNGRLSKDYEVKEHVLQELPQLSSFMEECLKSESFHVIRSEQYLQWKYVCNPRTKSRVLSINRNGKREGVVIFSESMEQNVVHAKANVVKVYDSIIAPHSCLTHKDLLHVIVSYCRQHGEELDMIKSLQNTTWYPVFFYPRHREVLSTLDIEKLPSAYLSYMDQDMEG